jgi:hypothetical protein
MVCSEISFVQKTLSYLWVALGVTLPLDLALMVGSGEHAVLTGFSLVVLAASVLAARAAWFARLQTVVTSIAGAFLVASPWLASFDQRIFWPHLVLGLAAVGAGLPVRRNMAVRATGDDKSR